jgi:hypothetical protein
MRLENSTRRKEIPIDAAADTRLHSTAINTVALTAQYAGDDGVVGLDEDGRSLADPRVVAEHLGAGASTVAKAFIRLENLGYIEWTRGWKSGPHDRPGSIRIRRRSAAA